MASGIAPLRLLSDTSRCASLVKETTVIGKALEARCCRRRSVAKVVARCNRLSSPDIQAKIVGACGRKMSQNNSNQAIAIHDRYLLSGSYWFLWLDPVTCWKTGAI